jgi:D-beta-D-heptose 7-phosphate kinase/D-beta-D-heptose 1-phosphate adenosyltransferase
LNRSKKSDFFHEKPAFFLDFYTKDISVSPKLWGYEIWYVNTFDYCCKMLVVYPGFQVSRHFHKKKDETFTALDGDFELEVDGRLVYLKRGGCIRIKPFTVHNFRVVGDQIGSLLEVSTNHREDDSYRVDVSHHFHLGGITVSDVIGLVGDFRKAHIAVVGDFVLDGYAECPEVIISPEAPCPLWYESSRYYKAGCAGNVAVNITSLGAKATAFGIIGDDSDGESLSMLLSNSGVNIDQLFKNARRSTIMKLRIMTGNYHHGRLDKENRFILSDEEFLSIMNCLKPQVRQADFDALLFSDYDKGLLTPERIKEITELSRYDVPIIADPKYNNFWAYKNCTVVKCNRKEAAAAIGVEHTDLVLADDVLRCAWKIMEGLECEAVIITRGKDGMTVARNDGDFVHIPSKLIEVSELSGAGDTVAAVVSIMAALSNDVAMDIFDIAEVANTAASLVVQKTGTATCTPTELAAAL